MTSSSLRLLASVASTSLILALAAGSAAAQSNAAAPGQQSVVLDTIVVEGQGGQAAAPLVDGPTTTTTTRQELDRQQVQSIADLANRVEAGITFNRNTNSINIRGLEGNRVLTTLDGIRLPFLEDNTRSVRGGANAFDFDALSTLDLMRGGAGASTLGGGALGGALALRTLDPKDLIRGHSNFGALAKVGFDSTDRAWFGSAAAAARAGNTYALIQGSFRDGHENDTKGNVKSIGPTRSAPNPLDFTQYSFLGKIHHYVDEVHRFGITGEFFRREDTVQRRDNAVSLTGNTRPGSYNTGDEVERKRVSLSYDYKLPGAFLDEAHATLYWQNIKRSALIDGYRFTSVPGPYKRDNQIEQDAFGFNGYAVKNFQTGIATHRVTLGTELRMTKLTQYTAGIDSCRPPYTGAFAACGNLHTNQADQPDVDGKMVGIFLHDEIGLLDNRLRLTPGVRFDWYEEQPKATAAYTRSPAYPGYLPPSSSESAWSPRLRLEYDIVKNAPWVKDVTVFAQWAKGFRAPTASELYGRFGGPGTYLRTGNAELRPEISNGIDIGVRFGDRQFGGSLTYFHSNYRNFIETYQVAVSTPEFPFGITSYRNIAQAEIQGFEANLRYAFAENWLVRGSFAYTRGRNKTANTFLNTIPPVQGIVAVAYGTERWGAEVSAKFAGKRDDVAATTGADQGFRAPGYAVFNASAWWKPLPQVADLELQVGVYNIFDRKYFDAVTVPTGVLTQARDYYSEPGRTVKATLKYQF